MLEVDRQPDPRKKIKKLIFGKLQITLLELSGWSALLLAAGGKGEMIAAPRLRRNKISQN